MLKEQLMQAIAGLLFDKDGTLFDFNATWTVWAHGFLGTLAGGDTDRATALGQAIGFDYIQRAFDPLSPVVAGTPEDIAALLLPELPGRAEADLIHHMNTAAADAPMAEAAPLAPLLDEFAAQGIKLGVATNDAEAPARAHLAEAGVELRFDFIAGSDSGFGAKPRPGQLLAFLETTGLMPEQALMIGDSRHDLLAGRAAGMGTVAVLTGLATSAELSDLADVILPDIGHLPAYLAGGDV